MTISGDSEHGLPGVLGADGFTDVHCHCLPGLDDGPADMAEALALCRALVADGIGVAVATPHQLGRFDGFCEGPRVRQAVARLNDAFAESGIALTVLPGADVRLDERIPRLLQSDRVLTLGDNGRYLLLELPPDVFIDPQTLLERLASMQVTVVITHPERHGFLACHPTYVDRWARYGACLQLTAGSLVGLFGRQCEQAAWNLLDSDLAAVVATDAHNVDSRVPSLTAAHHRLSERFGQAAAWRWCGENPKRLAAGRELLMSDMLSSEKVQ